MKNSLAKITKSLIVVGVVLITILLVLNIIVTNANNKIIEENKLLQQNAEQVKIAIADFAIEIIHNLDLGIRSYALFKDEKYLYPLRFALKNKDSLISVVENRLIRQQYPMEEFLILKDSINGYAKFCSYLLTLLNSGEPEEFLKLADLDKGYKLWLQYEKVASKIYQFENEINEKAQARYHTAIRNDFLIQLMLLVLCLPTLIVTSVLTIKKFSIELELRKSEEEKNSLLAVQNETLNSMVDERTREITEKNRALQLQHEEIAAQNEEITTQNDELYNQREALAAQNDALIQSRKEQIELYIENLLEKSMIIEQISDELSLLKNEPNDSEQIKKFNDVLNSHIVTEEDWERFKKAFDLVYPEFFAHLRYRFPDITVSELRLSALIKINLTAKEAGNTLGISAESVKKSRYRLKKKIGLPTDESLEKLIRNI